MLPLLIACSGYAQAGKDTVGNYLVKEYGYTRMAFADKLREGLLLLNPTVQMQEEYYPLQTLVTNLGWEIAKTTVPEVRSLLQRFGTDVGRALVGPDIWIKLLFRDWDEEMPIVITDCRFPNEAKGTLLRGGRVIRINREGYRPINAHPSEQALDAYDFDAYLNNDGSFSDLFVQVDHMMRRFHVSP